MGALFGVSAPGLTKAIGDPLNNVMMCVCALTNNGKRNSLGGGGGVEREQILIINSFRSRNNGVRHKPQASIACRTLNGASVIFHWMGLMLILIHWTLLYSLPLNPGWKWISLKLRETGKTENQTTESSYIQLMMMMMGMTSVFTVVNTALISHTSSFIATEVVYCIGYLIFF